MLGGFAPGVTQSNVEELADGLETILATDSMAPRSAKAVIEKKGWSLLWAISYGLQKTPSQESESLFLAALPLILDTWRANGGVHVDMRLPDDRCRLAVPCSA